MSKDEKLGLWWMLAGILAIVLMPPDAACMRVLGVLFFAWGTYGYAYYKPEKVEP